MPDDCVDIALANKPTHSSAGQELNKIIANKSNHGQADIAGQSAHCRPNAIATGRVATIGRNGSLAQLSFRDAVLRMALSLPLPHRFPQALLRTKGAPVHRR